MKQPPLLVAEGCSADVFVVAGFPGSALLFNNPRLLHTGANVIVAEFIVWMLWKDASEMRRLTIACAGDGAGQVNAINPRVLATAQ